MEELCKTLASMPGEEKLRTSKLHNRHYSKRRRTIVRLNLANTKAQAMHLENKA